MNEPAPPSRTLMAALREVPGEFRALAARFPQLVVLGVFLLGWLALFQFFGNSTLGYVNTTSLFGWMEYAYWGGSDDRVGYLVPWLVLGLLWWRREELAAVPKRTWWPGLALVALAVAIHVFGFIIQQTRLSVVAFFAGLWLLTGVVWGPAWLRASFFPFCLLAFAVPLGNAAERITFPLRILATQISVGVANLAFGIDVARTGTSILDSTGRYQYEVAAACSGIRSLTAIFALTVIYAFTSFRSAGRRLVILASAFPLAVAGNVLRLLAIILAAEAFGQQAGNKVHDSAWFSLVPYLPSILGLVLLGRWLKEEPRERSSLAVPCRPTNPELLVLGAIVAAAMFGADTPTGARVTEGLIWLAADIALALSLALAGFLIWAGLKTVPGDGAAPVPWPRALVVATFLLLGAGGWAGLHLQRTQHLGKPGVRVVAEPIYGRDSRAEGTNAPFLARSNSVYLPPRVLDWASEPLPLERMVLDYLPRDTTFGQRQYRAPDGLTIQNMVVLMGADRTSIHQPQYCLTGSGWRITQAVPVTIPIARPVPYELPAMRLTTRARFHNAEGQPLDLSGVFVYWFVADGRLTADHADRMWSMARHLVQTGELQRWAYVICFAVCPPGQEDAAYARVEKFIAASVPEYHGAPPGGGNPASPQASPSP